MNGAIKATNLAYTTAVYEARKLPSGPFAAGNGWSYASVTNNLPGYLIIEGGRSFVSEVAEGADPFSRIVGDPSPPKSYEVRQREWMDQNQISAGVLVRVTREAESYENGWGTSWEWGDMHSGQVLKVKQIDEQNYGLELSNGYLYPYFVLERVNDNT